jgi:hypothetical protein
MNMATIIVRHEVEDFDKWKPAFESDIPKLKELGMTNEKVYRDKDNPNIVTVIGDCESVDKIMEYMGSDEIKEKMASGGVVGKPEVFVMESA